MKFDIYTLHGSESNVIVGVAIINFKSTPGQKTDQKKPDLAMMEYVLLVTLLIQTA